MAKSIQLFDTEIETFDCCSDGSMHVIKDSEIQLPCIVYDPLPNLQHEEGWFRKFEPVMVTMDPPSIYEIDGDTAVRPGSCWNSNVVIESEETPPITRYNSTLLFASSGLMQCRIL